MYSNFLMEVLRRRYAPSVEDKSMDSYIMTLTPKDVLDTYLSSVGLSDYTNILLSIMCEIMP